MLNVVTNPYSNTLKNLFSDFKDIKWKFPFILQSIHSVITLFLLIFLLFLYITLGFISQISNTFWDYLTLLGRKMSFSSPIQTLFYAFSITVYFLLFFPFFLFQLPFWVSGWITSKIGIKVFLILLLTTIISIGLYFFNPSIATKSFGEISKIHESIKVKYFGSDSLNTTKDAAIELTTEVK